MIKVIKHGQTEFECTCGRCGCEFTYEYEDIHTEANRGLTITYSSTSTSSNVRYVKCPDCGNLCYLTPYSNWPPSIEPIPTGPFNTPSGTKDCQDCDWWKKITQPGGFTYVGDTPCTWCSKSPYRVLCDSDSSSNVLNSTKSIPYTLCTDKVEGIANEYTKVKCDLGSTSAYSGNIGSFNINSMKEETANG